MGPVGIGAVRPQPGHGHERKPPFSYTGKVSGLGKTRWLHSNWCVLIRREINPPPQFRLLAFFSCWAALRVPPPPPPCPAGSVWLLLACRSDSCEPFCWYHSASSSGALKRGLGSWWNCYCLWIHLHESATEVGSLGRPFELFISKAKGRMEIGVDIWI